MTPRDILDSSIIDTPPPFSDLDGLIARERRRRRRRTLAATVTGASGVIAAVLGVVLVSGPLGTPSGTGAEPSTDIPLDESAEARYARLSDLLRARVAAVLPDATLTPADPADADVFGPRSGVMSDVVFAGYDYVGAAAVVTTPAESMNLAVNIVRPLVPPRPQPTDGVAGRLFGGCAGEWSTQTPAVSGLDRCEDRVGPGGTAVSVAERQAGMVRPPADPLTEVGRFRWVTVAFPDGGVVTIITDLDATLLSPDDLIEIAADPGFVAGQAAPPHEPAIVDPTDPQAVRDLPTDPEIGTVYPFDLYTHCGIDLVRFDGRTWRTDPPYDGNLPDLYLAGTLELLDHATARFVVDQRHFATDREVIAFYWVLSEEAPRCA